MCKDLDDIYSELEVFGWALDMGNPSIDLINNIKALEEKKQNMIDIQQVIRRLKSWAIWFGGGDRNTKFFHRFANYRRQVNSIWNINDSNYYVVHTKGISK